MKSKNINKLLEKTANISLIAITSFFIAYHLLATYNIIPTFLGGFIGPVSAMIFIVFLTFSPWVTLSLIKKTKYYGFCFLIFNIIVLFYTLYAFIVPSPIIGVVGAQQSLYFFIYSNTMFYIAYFATDIRKKTRVLFFTTLSVLFIFLVYLMFAQGQVVFNAAQINGENTELTTYQGLARSVILILLFLLSSTKKNSSIIILIYMGIVILFLLGSRSDLFAFLVVVVMYILIKTSRRNFFAIAFVFLLIVLSLFSAMSNLNNSRNFSVANIEEDYSWNRRQQYQDRAIYQIKENPILGQFSGHVVTYPVVSTGRYSHNALSAWVNYGIFGFLIYMMLSIIPLLHGLFSVFILRNNSTLILLSLFMSTICVLLIIVSKSVFWIFAPFAWGVYARLIKVSAITGKKNESK